VHGQRKYSSKPNLYALLGGERSTIPVIFKPVSSVTHGNVHGQADPIRPGKLRVTSFFHEKRGFEPARLTVISFLKVQPRKGSIF